MGEHIRVCEADPVTHVLTLISVTEEIITTKFGMDVKSCMKKKSPLLIFFIICFGLYKYMQTCAFLSMVKLGY